MQDSVPTAPSRRLVVMLGLGNPKAQLEWRYGQCRYQLPDTPPWPTDDTPPAPLAIGAHVAHAKQVGRRIELVLVGSSQAQEAWIASGKLHRYLDQWQVGVNTQDVRFVEAPDGANRQDAAEFVKLLTPLLTATPEQEVHFDLTHGFRAQSVLATAAVETVVNLALRDGRQPGLTVWYTAFEVKQEVSPGEFIAPLWDLTGMVVQHIWEMAIHNLVRHGRADAFAGLCEDLGTRLLRQDHSDRTMRGAKKHLYNLAKAAKNAADGVVTVRTGELLTQDAARLVTAIDLATTWVLQEAPTCGEALRDLRESFAGIAVDRVQSADGVRATVRLARLAFDMQRYSECVTLLREATVTQLSLAQYPDAQPGPKGTKDYNAVRRQMDDVFSTTSTYRGEDPLRRFAASLPDLRNDVQHAAMRSQPLSAKQVRQQVQERLSTLETLLGVSSP